MPDFPVPLTFELPSAEWEAVDPASLDVRDAAFLAVHRERPGDYTPTLSIAGALRPDDASVLDIADESLAVLAEQAADVQLVHRQATGDAAAPSVAQVIGLRIVVEGRTLDLRQAQVVSAMYDVEDRARRAVLLFTLTAGTDQIDDLIPEFQTFVRSIRPGAPAAR